MAFTLKNNTTNVTYTLPAPDKNGIKISPLIQASSDNVLSGKFRADVTSERRLVESLWPMLTETERTSLKATYVACKDYECTLTLHNGEAITVYCGHRGWNEKWFFDWEDAIRYIVTLQFEEVDADA